MAALHPTPYSVEAEEAVLGSILIDPEAILCVMPLLRVPDFFVVKNGWVWDVLVSLHERREPVDFLTVCNELETRGQLAEAGGAAYVSHLINVVPTAIHAEGYARIVERAALKRRLLGAASDIARLAYDEDQANGDQDDLVAQAAQMVFNTQAGTLGRNVLSMHEASSRFYDRIRYLYDHAGEPLGIPTGLGDLDQLLGGLQRGDLVIVAARPGVGKSSLLASIMLNAARRFRQRTLMFSLEMSSEQVTQRLVSLESGINGQRLRLGQLREDEWPLFIQATDRLSGYPLWIDDTAGIPTTTLRAKASRMRAERGLDLVLIDYLQLMSAPGRHENRTQEVGAISRALKNLAIELNVPVVAASQLSRATCAKVARLKTTRMWSCSSIATRCMTRRPSSKTWPR
jgi:replicative DNA helicase